MPFAWAIKSVYKKTTTYLPVTSVHSSIRIQSTGVNHAGTTCKFQYDLNDAEFLVYQQDMSYLSDEDLFKYLSDFSSKEKYYSNRLIQMNIKLDVKLIDMKACNAVNLTSNNTSLFIMRSRQQVIKKSGPVASGKKSKFSTELHVLHLIKGLLILTQTKPVDTEHLARSSDFFTDTTDLCNLAAKRVLF